MTASGVLIAGALGLMGAVVYVALANLELRRARRSHEIAASSMALFWAALALHLAVDSAWGIAGALGPIAPALSETVLHLKTATGALAFAGLVYHLLYLYSGRTRLELPVLLYFLVAFALVEFNYLARGPLGHEMTAWAARHAFERPGGAFEDVALVLLFLPGFVASIAYAGLARHVGPDPARRRRHLARALGLAGFFGGLLVGFVADWSWWEPAERFIALSTGAIALAGAQVAPVSAADPQGAPG